MSSKTQRVAGMAARGDDVETPTRPLRRDAEFNLARILDAARDAFAEVGYDASMEQIAARAEVGVGTLYRRFPNKADLFDAVADEASRRSIEIARAVLTEADPADAVVEFLWRCIAVPSGWRATISRPPWSRSGARTAWAEMAPLLEQILSMSQGAGTVRDDIEVTDIVVTLMAVRAVADLCDGHAPESSLRFLELALDGLRPGHRPPRHSAMSNVQLGDIVERT